VGIITLTTDFGTQDWFVGAMKGVILDLAPQTQVIDITHEIPPGNIAAGAFALASAFNYFPRGTVHVAVVDPGVGSDRPALAVKSERFTFVGPDNGLLSWAMPQPHVKAVYSLDNPKYFLHRVSGTFHGRDVFAPIAAHLVRGVPLAKLGTRMDDFIRLPWPEPKRTGAGISGSVVYIDRFGNGITSIPGEMLRGGSEAWDVCLRGRRVCSVARYYQAVPAGHPVAVVGSTGYLEMAICGGNAAQRLRLNCGTKVQVRSCRRDDVPL
jgi:S-adenosyl-L-methionine hydrolase (adenosine-forming)